MWGEFHRELSTQKLLRMLNRRCIPEFRSIPCAAGAELKAILDAQNPKMPGAAAVAAPGLVFVLSARAFANIGAILNLMNR